MEKARKCEALGAEVIQTTVGPELFYMLLRVLDETGFYNASLYTPFSVQGIETLGVEIAEDILSATGQQPTVVLSTHAGGGLCTGVGRGLLAAGCKGTKVIGVSVDLRNLHMASDGDFNRKSFTTGHTGFSVPFTTWPDRVDVPKSAARPLRYLDRLLAVTQGGVFFATEMLAQLEGLERGPAGNTSLAGALSVARDLPMDDIVVVTETECTGAGKTPLAQLEFAQRMGVEVATGNEEEIPGTRIVLPTSLNAVSASDIDLNMIRDSYIRIARSQVDRPFTLEEKRFLVQDAALSASKEIDLDRMA